MSDDHATLTTEPYGDTHAVILRDRGTVHVLYTAAATLPAQERHQACENVSDGIKRAVGVEEEEFLDHRGRMTTAAAKAAAEQSMKADAPVVLEWTEDLSDALTFECSSWEALAYHRATFHGRQEGARWEVRLVPNAEPRP